MRVLLTAVADNKGEAPEMEGLAQGLAEVGHEVNLFLAPDFFIHPDEYAFVDLSTRLKQSLDVLQPDVIECHDASIIAFALTQLGYSYIVNLSDSVDHFELIAQEYDKQNIVIERASFIFTQSEAQKNCLRQELALDEKKLVTLPLRYDGHLLAERLAYYQQMMVRHSLH